jgi:photosystem II stability/assembly factor-like uncharacterized protein
MMKYTKGLLLPALLALASSVTAAKDAPLVETNSFSNELVNLQYFDDSTVVLVQELGSGKVWRSPDAGKDWKELKDLKRSLGIVKNPFDNQVALVLGEDKHWITYDQGKTWQDFETKYSPSPNGPVSWHSQDNKKILINEIEDCLFTPCLGVTYYTTDGFKTKPKTLVEDRRMCQWAKGAERFLEGQEKHDDRILCILRGKYSDRSKDFRLMISDE